MKVGELIEKLSRLDPEMVVVMEQNDEPLGEYEVLDVAVVDAEPHSLFHSSAPSYGRKPWAYPQVWNTYDGKETKVVLLGSEPPWQPTIDADLAVPELTSGDRKAPA